MPRFNMCEDCKNRLRPATFSMLFTAVNDICSFCGKPNFDGIYVREKVNQNPLELPFANQPTKKEN